jgi:hypothetical protein
MALDPGSAPSESGLRRSKRTAIAAAAFVIVFAFESRRPVPAESRR